VGRHPECDVRIELRKISRRHCCLALVYDRVVIRDLGSRNGVRVNGSPVDEATLLPGDEVAIGPVIFRVEGVSDEPQERVAAQPGQAPVGSAPPLPAADTPTPLPDFSADAVDDDSELIPLIDL
jgi:pSer/pThr/pTyr-binding forkhead associated (FHA) protein